MIRVASFERPTWRFHELTSATRHMVGIARKSSFRRSCGWGCCVCSCRCTVSRHWCDYFGKLAVQCVKANNYYVSTRSRKEVATVIDSQMNHSLVKIHPAHNNEKLETVKQLPIARHNGPHNISQLILQNNVGALWWGRDTGKIDTHCSAGNITHYLQMNC
jgi:hypothetical protein